MKDTLKREYIVVQIALMTLFTFCKILMLYKYTYTPSSLVAASIRTILILLSIYTIINFFLFRRVFTLRLILPLVFGIVVLADIMYYKHFQVLPSASQLGLIDNIPSIKSSIKHLFDYKYILLFLDIPVLILHHLLSSKQAEAKPAKTKYYTAAALVLALALVLTVDVTARDSKNDFQIFNEFGLVHFHIKQFASLGVEKKIDPSIGESISVFNNTSIPDENSKYFGLAKDKNVIIIQIESFQNFLINRYYNNQELTPNLNKLINKDSIYFDNYYQLTGIGGTSDAEFAVQNSIYSSMEAPVYKKYSNNSFLSFPKILKELGYSTNAFHGYKPDFWNRQEIYPNLGFDQFTSLNEFDNDEIIGWGLSDGSFFRQTAERLKGLKQPFYGFLITLTSHHPYTMPDEHKKIELLKEHDGLLIGNYLQSVNYVDACIGEFIELLKSNNLYDDSIIVLYGDHHGINSTELPEKKAMSELLGYDYDFDEMFNIPLIIHVPGSDIAETNSIVGGHIDFLPTMLNLLGIQESRINFFGQDLNNAEKGFMALQSYLAKGSFIDDEKFFVMAGDGVFEHSRAWYLETRTPVDLSLCRENYERAVKAIDESDYIMSNNLLKKLFEK